MTRTIWLPLLILNLVVTSFVDAQKPALDSLIKSEMNRLRIPGFEVVAINNGDVIWTGYYGYQHLEKKIPVTSQTIFEAVSTSKKVTAAVMMQLLAAKKYQLDDDINKYLDFKLVNPHHPKVPITSGNCCGIVLLLMIMWNT